MGSMCNYSPGCTLNSSSECYSLDKEDANATAGKSTIEYKADNL